MNGTIFGVLIMFGLLQLPSGISISILTIAGVFWLDKYFCLGQVYRVVDLVPPEARQAPPPPCDISSSLFTAVTEIASLETLHYTIYNGGVASAEARFIALGQRLPHLRRMSLSLFAFATPEVLRRSLSHFKALKVSGNTMRRCSVMATI